MPLLLDTHVLLWALSDPSKLSVKVRQRLQAPDEVVFVSAASLWEIGIKSASGKLAIPNDLEGVLRATRFSPLPITWIQALAAGRLPPHHHDPFDRMLVAQALTEGLTLLTHDRHLKLYGSFVHLI